VGWTIGIQFQARAGTFAPCHCIQTGFGTHPASCAMGAGDLCPGVKWPQCEADHSRPFSAEVKIVRSYTSTPQYVFMVW